MRINLAHGAQEQHSKWGFKIIQLAADSFCGIAGYNLDSVRRSQYDMRWRVVNCCL